MRLYCTLVCAVAPQQATISLLAQLIIDVTILVGTSTTKGEERNAFPESKTCAGGEENVYTPHHDPKQQQMPALSFKRQRGGFSWASHSPVKSPNAGKLHARRYLLQFDRLIETTDTFGM